MLPTGEPSFALFWGRRSIPGAEPQVMLIAAIKVPQFSLQDD